MIDFIIKYWLEVLFGIIIGVLSYFVKRYYQLWKKEKEFIDKNRIDEGIKELKTSIDTLGKAVLEVQKKQFKIDCKFYLEDKHEISFEQFQNLQDEYEIYKSLGGNGPGHTLFELVQEKYSAQMMQKYQVDLLSENFDLQPRIYIPTSMNQNGTNIPPGYVLKQQQDKNTKNKES